MMTLISINYLIENLNNKFPSSLRSLLSSIDLSMRTLNTIKSMQLIMMLLKLLKLQMHMILSWRVILEQKIKIITKVSKN